jgi:hypothetical protein
LVDFLSCWNGLLPFYKKQSLPPSCLGYFELFSTKSVWTRELQNHSHFRCAHTLPHLPECLLSGMDSSPPRTAPNGFHQHLGLPGSLPASGSPVYSKFGVPKKLSPTTQSPGKRPSLRDSVQSGDCIVLQCCYKKHLVSVDTPIQLFGPELAWTSTRLAEGCLLWRRHTCAYFCGEPSQGAGLTKMLLDGNPKDNGRREPASQTRKLPSSV